MDIGPVKISSQPSFNAHRSTIQGAEGQEEQGAIGSTSAEKKDSGRKDLETNESLGQQALTAAELKQVQQLKQADTVVRAHELAHVAAGGKYVKSGARFEYERGPDGKSYAVAGEVGIDISAVPGDPKATVDKMETVQRAALAPKDPSAQDRRVAAKASQLRTKASMDLTLLRSKGNDIRAGDDAAYRNDKGAKAYSSDEKTTRTGSIIHTVG